MNDHIVKSKPSKKKNKKHHHYHQSNGTKKALLKPPIHTNDGHNINGQPHIIVQNNYELDVIVKAKAFSFNPKTNSYILKLENCRILSVNNDNVIFEIPPNKIHKTSQTQLLHEDDIDAILDEIHHSDQIRHQIKQHHEREESKQQIPIITNNNNNNMNNNNNNNNINNGNININGNNHQVVHTMDSLRSIPPIPSRPHTPHSYNKYRNDINNNNIVKKKHELINEWKQISLTHNVECIDGESMRHCQSVERVKFMLKYYAKWVKIRTTKSSEAQNNIESVNAMKYFENITSLFIELGYNAILLTNDFEHIREFHINNNSSLLLNEEEEEEDSDEEEDSNDDDILDSVSQQNNNNNKKKKKKKNKMNADTMEYFGLILGKCDAKTCNILLRHCRDRDKIDNKQELKRKKLFFISDDKFGGDNIEWIRNEIYLETKLDIIHCALLHQQTNVMLLNKNKFITEIVKNDDKGNDESEEIKLNKYGTINKKKIMAFGESITYWDNKHHLFISHKYNNLRTELLNNKLYSISHELFEQIKYFCLSFLNCRNGRLIISQREHDWMKSYKINTNSQITMSHLIAIYSYTNLTLLREIFLEFGYRHYYNHEMIAAPELEIKHREIWNWSRLLLECVHCFGEPFNEYWRYYHGINCKLLFDRFNIMIDIPISLTLDKDFAYTFSSSNQSSQKDGIMVELNHGTLSDLQSLNFDNGKLSEFPFEEERFIFHSYVSIKDIVINGLHHDQWLKIFGFWYKLKEGFFFDHLIRNACGVTKNDQLCICAMIINMMLGNENIKHNKYDQRIPYYMQCLFNECIQNKAFVWIIESEYIHLAPKLKSLLYYDSTNLNNSSQFIKYLITEKKCNVCKCNTFNWTIQKNQFNDLFINSNQWIKSIQYKIYLYFNKNYNIKYCLSFHFQVQNKLKNGLFRCRIHLDEFPKQIHKINLGVGIYVDKVNIDNYSYAEIQTKHKLYNSSLHSLFKTKLLRKFNKLNLKLQIQLFYLHDQNGKLIKFQPV